MPHEKWLQVCLSSIEELANEEGESSSH